MQIQATRYNVSELHQQLPQVVNNPKSIIVIDPTYAEKGSFTAGCSTRCRRKMSILARLISCIVFVCLATTFIVVVTKFLPKAIAVLTVGVSLMFCFGLINALSRSNRD